MIRRVAMVLLIGVAVIIVAILAYGAWRSQSIVSDIVRKYPPLGSFVEAGGERVHYVDLGDKAAPAEKTILMLHGASANLRDLMTSIAPPLAAGGRVILIDRPGHGWTSRRAGRADAQLARQADIAAALLDTIGVKRAIVLGHSWAGALALRLALDHPDHVAGLILISPVTHPWPGGVGWINDVAVTPVIGWLFTHTIIAPVGIRSLMQGIAFVFAPAEPPAGYIEQSGLPLLLRPNDFLANAEDLVDLKPQIVEQAQRYGGLKLPVLVIVGTTDNVVSPVIHSKAIAREIAGAKLIELDGAGHVPIRSRTDIVVGAIETFIAGLPATASH